MSCQRDRSEGAKGLRLSKSSAAIIVYRPPPAGGKQVAWRLCRNVITHALDYDCRVLPSSLVLPHAEVVERQAWRVVEAVVGRELTAQQKEQIQLPTSFAGCQMPMPTLLAPLARAADIIETGHVLRRVVAQWGHDMATACSMDGADDAVAQGIFESLAERGVELTAPGVAQPRGSARRIVSEVSLLRPSAPDSHTLSRLLRASATARHTRLLRDAAERDRIRLNSAGGPNAGKALVAPAGLRAAHFSDEHFASILHWRLGCSFVGGVSCCKNYAASTGETCDAVLDAEGDHAVCCAYGPLRIKRHDAYADDLAEIIMETGAHARREAYVKAFTTPVSEAWLDIWAFGKNQLQDLLVDVTIRHPASSAYRSQAADEVGFAAKRAEEQKVERYPTKDGRSVVPFAVETWGRIGEQGEQLLQTLAAEATRHSRSRGHQVTAGAFLRRWRAGLDAVLQRGVAMCLDSARHGLPGHVPRGCKPAQRQGVDWD